MGDFCCPSFVVLTDLLFLKHGSRILRQSSNPACGFSMTEQVRLCAVWPTENWLGFCMNHLQGWMNVWECCRPALEKGCLFWSSLRRQSHGVRVRDLLWSSFFLFFLSFFLYTAFQKYVHMGSITNATHAAPLKVRRCWCSGYWSVNLWIANISFLLQY